VGVEGSSPFCSTIFLPPEPVSSRYRRLCKKAEGLRRGRFDLDHLLIYDLTGLGLLVPLKRGGPILSRQIREWHAKEAPAHRFGRVSILRDSALLLDLEGEGEILRGRSPYFQLPVVRAHDEEDLKRRLREIDRYCRQNSIRHLRVFGSIPGDRIEDFREDSDLDLLVEFEPGMRVTLLDMARMERELGAGRIQSRPPYGGRPQPVLQAGGSPGGGGVACCPRMTGSACSTCAMLPGRRYAWLQGVTGGR
jgi:predicted nucleotidyltransferase